MARVLFFGTPDIAVPCMEALAREHTVVGVVTKPDTPVGRKQIMSPTAVARLSLPVERPQKHFMIALLTNHQRFC